MSKLKQLKHIIAVTLITTFFITGCTPKLDYREIYNGNVTYGTLKGVELYLDMSDFISKLGFKYDTIVTLKDYFKYKYETEATKSEAWLKVKEDAGVIWKDDYNVIARYYPHGKPNPIIYSVGTYQGQPVVFIYKDNMETNLKKEDRKVYDITGELSKDKILVSFTGLYDEGFADDYIHKRLFLPCILIKMDSITN